MAANSICHVEWAVTDMDRAKAFYGGLFGWTFTDAGPDYALFATPEGPGGGLDRVDSVDGTISSPQAYVQVEDIDAAIAKAKDLGGGLIREKTDIGGGLGSYARINDPDGSPIGLWSQ